MTGRLCLLLFEVGRFDTRLSTAICLLGNVVWQLCLAVDKGHPLRHGKGHLWPHD